MVLNAKGWILIGFGFGHFEIKLQIGLDFRENMLKEFYGIYLEFFIIVIGVIGFTPVK